MVEKKHPSKKVTHTAAKNLPKSGQPKLEKQFEASIVSSAGSKTGSKKPKK